MTEPKVLSSYYKRMKNVSHPLSLFLTFFFTCIGCQAQPVKDTTNLQDTTHKKLTDSARFHQQKGDHQQALHYHKRALQHSRQSNLPEHEARTLVSIAGLLKKENAGASLQHLQKALEISQRIGHNTLKTDILLAMTEVYKQQENYKEALLALESHQSLLQSTMDQNKAREIAHIRATESARLERYLMIGTILFILLAGTVLTLYFYRMKRLNKQLQASNDVKDKLFSIIGHDLRGPAGGIMEALDIVDSGILDEREQKEVLGLLKKQSRSFNETLNSLLSWASTQLKGAETHTTRFELKSIVKKSLSILDAQVRKKQLTINNNVPDQLFVQADMNHIDFIIRNLLSNAIKFSYENNSIELAATRQEDEVVLSVADHGTGIPSDKQQMFSTDAKYMQSSYGTQGEAGTGLGLMLSKEFLYANNGRMWIQSEEGKGTTVFVALK